MQTWLSTMPPAQTLPYELLLDCFDYAAIPVRPLNNLPDLKFLRNLSLVSKQASVYAQKFIFRTIFRERVWQVLALKAATRPLTDKGRWLASLVINVRIIVNVMTRDGLSLVESVPSISQLNTEYRNVIRPLLLCSFMKSVLGFPNIREVDLVDTNTMDYATLCGFTTYFPIHLQTLRLSSWSPCDILRAFPTVQFLEIKFPIRHPRTPYGVPPACRLTEIHWQGGVDDHLLLILHNSVGSLEILAFRNIIESESIDPTHFESLLEKHGPTLRSLHIPAFPDSHFASLQHCTQLEELIIDGRVSTVALERIPDTIEHLKIQFPTPNNSSECCGRGPNHSNFITSLAHVINTAPSLVTFTWVDYAYTTPSQLQQACKRRSIHWRMWDEPYGNYPGEVCHNLESYTCT